MTKALLAIAVICCTTLCVAADPTINWVDCQQYVPPPLVTNFPPANTSVIPETLHCGQMVVPMDYERPLSGTNNITLGLAMYRPRNPKGVLFFNAGGSDQNTVFAWQTALGLHADFQPDFSGLLEYDLMMLDTRGTWFSNPTNVSMPLAGEMLSKKFPTSLSEFHDFVQTAAEVFQSWEQSSSPPGIVKYVRAGEVVQDLEMVREALGYEKIHFLADSYGTYRAEQYAATFPSRVGHFAVDAVVPHGLDLHTQAKYDILAIDRGIQRADAYCLNNSTCPFFGHGKGTVPHALELVLDRARNGTLKSCSGKSAKCSKNVSVHMVQSGVYGALQQDPDFPKILVALAAGVGGDGEGFVPSGPPPTIDQFWAILFLCSDNSLGEKTFAEYERVLSAVKKHDRYDIKQSLRLQMQLICSAWPYPVPPLQTLELNATMLLVTADFDNYAPTELTTFAWQHAPNSGLVVRHGDDHVSFQLPQQASTHITKEFLRTGILPAARDDTFVTVYEPGCERVPPVANPYDVPTGFAAGDVDSAPDS